MQYPELHRTKAEAIAAGVTKYFDGKPCKHGHIAPRYTNSNCQTCTMNRSVVWRRNNPGKEAIRLKRWYADNKEKVRATGLRSKRKAMGIPEPLRPKPELCECCYRKPVGINQMHLDHDHTTGKFRGWLCGSCNRGIGSLGDTVAGLRRALDYLRRNGST